MIHFDTIFLVDDDPINNLINKRLLVKVGITHQIIEFVEGEYALEQIQNQNSENNILIFLDINMPVLNGWEFLEKYVTNFPHRKDKIIILSSSIDFQDRQKAKAFDIVSGFLEKPLTIEKINSQLNKILT
jgi:CheY-like chemotaxis protein